MCFTHLSHLSLPNLHASAPIYLILSLVLPLVGALRLLRYIMRSVTSTHQKSVCVCVVLTSINTHFVLLSQTNVFQLYSDCEFWEDDACKNFPFLSVHSCEEEIHCLLQRECSFYIVNVKMLCFICPTIVLEGIISCAS